MHCFCGRLLKPPRKFCSRQCWREHIRSANPTRSCLVCGDGFQPIARSVKRDMGKYCSVSCSTIARRGTTYRTRKRPGHQYDDRMNWYLSRGWQQFSMQLRSNSECVTCATKVGLCVHHEKDPFPNRDEHLLFKRSNLVIMCRSCHMKEHKPSEMVRCAECENEFEAWPSKGRKYCSDSCYNSARKRVERTCDNCDASFLPDKPESRFCNIKCSTAFEGRKRKAFRPKFTCPNCSKTFTMPPSRARRSVARPCCSRPCAIELRRKPAS